MLIASEAGRLFKDENAEGPVTAVRTCRDMASVARGGLRPNERIVAEAVNRLLARLGVQR